MTNQIKKVETIESSNLLKLIPEKIERYKAAFNSLALGVLLSTGVASNEAKAADTFDDLRAATIYYNSMNGRLNKVTGRVEYLEKYADKNNARIDALELEIDALNRANNAYKKNTEIERKSNYSIKVDVKIGDHIFAAGSSLESSTIKGNLVKIDSATDLEGNKYTFTKEFWIERQYIDLN
ncbi:MAG: hypothetical protein PHG82_05275 [Candidatus Gracilibacteria bacterium]|nr:hypothetical protein [Candidatus Gracilibacteria bacterium]